MIRSFTKAVEINEICYFKRFNLEKDYYFDGHTHENSWELNVFIKGDNEITCGKSVFLAHEMQAVLIPPGVFHACGCSRKNNCEKLVVEFKADNFELAGKELFYQFDLNREYMSVINLLIEEGLHHSNMNSNGTAGELSGTCKKLIEAFLKFLMRMDNAPEYSGDNDSLIYHKAVKFMENNIDKNPSVEEIAKASEVCVTLIKRAFAKFTGKGVIAYFTEMKINSAKELLKSGKSCYDVSKALGFSSQAYFSRCFKKNAGVLPSKYEVK